MSEKTKQSYKLFLQWFGLITIITMPFTVAFELHIINLVNQCLK